MTWQQYRPGAWLNPLTPNWWLFWDQLDGFQLLNQPEFPDFVSENSPLQLQYQRHSDGWIDFFLGKAAKGDPTCRCSCIDSIEKLPYTT